MGPLISSRANKSHSPDPRTSSICPAREASATVTQGKSNGSKPMRGPSVADWMGGEEAMEIRGFSELTALSLSFPLCKIRIIIVFKYIEEKEKLYMCVWCVESACSI